MIQKTQALKPKSSNNKKQIAIDFANSLNNLEIEKIILFGSVARGEDNEDSDIDILIVTFNIGDDLKIEDEIYGKTFDILLKTGEYLSVKMIDSEHYKQYINFSFYKNIEKDGILIG
ncbi:nucleotidyltransferase domain-containing protein [Methanobrevibacter curvatus]|jgi:predicted nucleotidyltransferase|uniref:protein adenylyltransferase n=1 Tax=Methanobrevibacter curvatus TaxID=49547 RepID=A0A165Z172_9EURY|nr:nucleotidyltransferase domain-containing protein [Methanobrevibacter curvatus]KZX10119.1 nucleotidyltransferase domain protein [Methanobrevibacter curvatus]